MSFYRVSFGFTGFYWVFTEFKGVLSGFTDFQRVLQACTEFYWAFTGLYLALLGFAGFLPGFPVTWCISCAVAGDFDDFFLVSVRDPVRDVDLDRVLERRPMVRGWLILLFARHLSLVGTRR